MFHPMRTLEINQWITLFIILIYTQVTLQGSERWVSLSQPLKVKAFEQNLKMLLQVQPDRVIALGNFVSTYMKFFGRKCKIATFGFSKLTDLIEAVPSVAKVSFKFLFSYYANSMCKHYYKVCEPSCTRVMW